MKKVYYAYVYMGGIQKFKSLSLEKKIILGVTSLFVLVATSGGGKPAEKVAINSNSSDVKTVTTQADTLEQQKISTIENKDVTEMQTVPFESVSENDETMAYGTTQIITKGVEGARTIIYSMTYTNGIETSRSVKSNNISRQPVNQVTRIGTYVAPAKPVLNCDPNYLGGCVPNVSYDLDCSDISFSVEVVGIDTHRFDRDGDGYGCESN